jgi:hypothetical protein
LGTKTVSTRLTPRVLGGDVHRLHGQLVVGRQPAMTTSWWRRRW